MAGFLSCGSVSILTVKTLAQQSNIVPDNTLGSESSQVLGNFQGQSIEMITGGATRGINLFHSFKEFNISAGRSAYFFNSTVEAGGNGKGGYIDITAGTLSLTDGAQLQTITRRASDTQPAGRGNAGDVKSTTSSKIQGWVTLRSTQPTSNFRIYSSNKLVLYFINSDMSQGSDPRLLKEVGDLAAPRIECGERKH